MSYITSDFASKSDMRVELKNGKIIEEMLPKFKKAGAIRQTVSQIWNKEGVFRLGTMGIQRRKGICSVSKII